MSVFRSTQRNGRWCYDFRHAGRRFAGYCVDPDSGEQAVTRRDAKAIEEKIRVAARSSVVQSTTKLRPEGFTLAQAMLLHLDGNSESTKLHRSNLAHYSREILKFFGIDTPVSQITAIWITQYRAFCAVQTIKVWRGGPRTDRQQDDPRWWRDTGRKRSAASANHYLNCLRGALRAAHALRDPVTGESVLPFPPAVEPLPEPRRRAAPMPDAELIVRRAHATPWTQDAIDLARLFGLRRTEALIATVHHVRAEQLDSQAYLFLLFKGEETKSGCDEAVHGGTQGSELLSRLAKQARSRGIIHLIAWPGQKGCRAIARGEEPVAGSWKPLRSFRRSWRSTAGRAGIEKPHRFHDVRARYITELAKAAPARVVQAAARHSDFSTTQVYIDAAEMSVARAVNAAAPTWSSVDNAPPERNVFGGTNKTEPDSQTEVPNERKSRPRRAG
jgi:hypothetical protein